MLLQTIYITHDIVTIMQWLHNRLDFSDLKILIYFLYFVIIRLSITTRGILLESTLFV